MTKELEVRIDASETRYDRPQVQINEIEKLGLEANLALNFLDKWGMVMGEEIGEDSSGRTKWGPANPEWIVDRAFTIARLALDRARRDGLTIQMPTFAEIDAVQEQTKAAKEAKKTAKAS